MENPFKVVEKKYYFTVVFEAWVSNKGFLEIEDAKKYAELLFQDYLQGVFF